MFSTAAANIFSPSKNACMVRVAPLNGIMRYRNDPYRAKVIASPMLAASPLKGASMPAVPTLPLGHAAAVMSAHAMQVSHIASTIVAAPPAVSHGVSRVPEKESRSAPTVGSSNDAQFPSSLKHFAVIQFKHTTAYYVAPFRVSVGDYVFVEGDRGENLGIVQEITTEPPSFPVPCKIVRRGGPKDKEALVALRRKEAITTRAVSELADQTGFAARIVDTEFQFDGNKLTVFFSSKGPVDFRKLQRGLFRDYRCRIWLVNWNEITPSRTPSSATSPR